MGDVLIWIKCDVVNVYVMIEFVFVEVVNIDEVVNCFVEFVV